MVGCAACHTPLPSTTKIIALGGASFNDSGLYRSVIGSLQYLTITRPEICYCVNKLAQFVQSPLDSHWRKVKRVLRYLSGTASYGLHIKRDTDQNTAMKIVAYSDSDWVGDPDDRKSISGYCVFLGSNLVA
ncbi:secreted RxLR effector protein 161-like [Arachis stenosperma]|uniref:secreted RxLR effector protein 161-like n=1 Tax=Arachis stenosperma TaxID=217475 RepID=UPI0025AD0F19|nr:secreted RxLR effector protein 161-like [Arachis stenosperma]